MIMLKYPTLLTDLGHVGELGLALSAEAWLQEELALCREWGFQLDIDERDNRVRLRYDEEMLIPYWIQQEAPALIWNGLRVKGFLRLDSTNREACDNARGGAPEGTLIYAETQTAGRGRMDRNWFSPAGSGIYCSLILRPRRSWNAWPLLTHVAAIALIDALRHIERDLDLPRPLGIDLKWPNDVLLGGKKCAGILLESLPPDERGGAAIVGVGIDVHPGSVPEELTDVVTCVDDVAGVRVPRRRLLIRFLRHFQESYRLFQEGHDAEILERWKSLSSMWDGVAVTLREGATTRVVTTCGLDAAGALRVRTADGAVETIFAGDVSVRRL